ncbi:MAG: aldehyde ferredoxin oxidoreductase family protein, partial [Proteobacteria bacterium]|nr:aldehyde ferredoxin oxidoreductase family protein [Pseudomonadota bacterium]
GKVLWVDLSSGKIEEESLGEDTYRNYLAGYGPAAKLMMERQKPGVDPLGPDNILGITAGIMTGTQALFSGRFMVTAKSPATGGWGDSNCGGNFGPEFKRTGYDGVFFKGKSDKPVYLLIEGDKKELKDASEYWGKDAVEAEEALWKKHSDKHRVALIGTAGEKLSRIAGVVNDRGRLAARFGLGAVMGSKKLKAVVVKGKGVTPVADKEKLLEINKKFLASFQKGFGLAEKSFSMILSPMGHAVRMMNMVTRMDPFPYKLLMRRWGTAGFTRFSMLSGDSPIKNWKGSAPCDFTTKQAKNISDDNVLKLQTKRYACMNCPLGCGGILEVKDGAYPLHETHKPEYESLASLGCMSLNDDLHALLKMNDLANRAGMDTISLGHSLAFACEAFERGILTEKDTDGLKLTWGNGPALVKLTEKIINREGIGDLLADGVKVAAAKLGKGSEEFAIHAGGSELAMHDPRNDPGYGVGYSCSPTPGRHSTAVIFGEMQQIERKFKGVKPTPMLYSKKQRLNLEALGSNSAIGEVYWDIISCAGLCSFGSLTAGASYPVFEWINAATGWNLDKDEFRIIGERILTTKHLFNVREGIKPKDFKMAARASGRPPLKSGGMKGVTVPEKHDLNYYRYLGWDYETGKPNVQRLKELGLDKIAGI